MAAMNFDDVGGRPLGERLAALANWSGAALSVLLIAGLGVWGWKLWVRDVTGVPVIRALEGPMRVAPEDPGGKLAEYQGLAVNRIAETRPGDGLVDQVTLAPASQGLDATEDLPMAALAPVEPAHETLPAIDTGASVEAAPAPGPDTGSAVASEPNAGGSADPSATDMAVALALRDALGAAETPSKYAPGNGFAVPLHTPRPQDRPEVRPVAAKLVMQSGSDEVDPATIPAGTRLVQLGAFGSAEVAREEWTAVTAQFSDYMAGKQRVVQEAQAGGRTFWRLRALGFSGLDDARRFCSVLIDEGANCIPVVQD